MQHEAAEKLFRRDSDLLVAAGAEGDAARVEPDEAMVRQADTVGVAAEVAKHLVTVAEGRLAVDDPALLLELVAQGLESGAVGEARDGPDELELARRVGAAQAVEELSAQQLAQGAHGKQEVRGRGDPALTIERQATTGDDAVDMRVEAKLACPGVQHAGDPDMGAEPPGISRELGERLGGAGEQQIEDALAIVHGELAQLARQGEDDMKAVRRQHPLAPLFHPAGLGQTLALRTVPIATRIVRLPIDIPALLTHVLVSTERGRAATRDVAQHGALVGRQGVRALEALAVGANDVRDLQVRPHECGPAGGLLVGKHGRQPSFSFAS